jgi:hypothetical protein
MLNISSLELKVAGVDISRMVHALTLYESLNGGVKGSFVIQDNINFYDTFIAHFQPSAEIAFNYLGIPCKNTFACNGITNMNIKKLGKTYIMHFISYPSVNMEMESLNLVYSGPSHTILKAMWYETQGNHLPLRVDSKAVTKGRYIVPSVKAGVAIGNILKTMYDDEQTAFCLYQRLWDNGASRLSSFDYMNKNYFLESEQIGTNVHYNKFVIKHTMAGTSSEQDGLSSLNEVGTSNDFKLEEFQKDFYQKLGAGWWGGKITHIRIDETTREELKPAEATKSLSQTRYKLSNKLYDDNTQSIFSTIEDPAAVAAFNAKNRILQGQYLKVNNMTPVPGLGVGFCVMTDQGGSNISQSRQDNNYIVSNINHKITLDGGVFNYTQDVGLIRE